LYKRLVLFLLVGIHSVVISQELSYNHYTVHDGLAQMQVEDLLLDSKGALWVATRGGVSRFNGYSFDSFEDLDIKPGFCSEIIEDHRGKIIILGSEGLYLYSGSKFTFFKVPYKTRFNQLSSLTIDNENRIWLNQYNSSPIVFQDSTFKTFSELYPETKLDSVRQVHYHEESKSLLVEIYRKGIFKISNSKFEHIFKSDRITRIFTSKLDGSDSNDFYLREFNGNKSSVYSLGDDLEITQLFKEESGSVTELLKPTENELLYTDRPVENLFLLKPGESQSYKLISNLNDKFNYPGEVYFGDDGNIFLESDKGLIVINSNRFESIDETIANNVWSINQLPNGNMIFGGYGSGLKIFDGKSLPKNIEFKEQTYCQKGTLSFQTKYVYMGSSKGLDNDLIIPTHETLLKFKDGNLSIFDYERTCDGIAISLYVHADLDNQRILSATCNGLRILDKNGTLMRNVKDGLFDHKCLLTINQDSKDNYWIGATGGIAKYNFDTQQITNYTLANGGFPYKGVVCTYIDHRGTLWAGSREGLTYFDTSKDKFIALEGFRGMEVASMIAGEENQLFLSTAGALVEANLESFYKDGKMLHRVYDKNSGLGIIGSGQNGFFKDTDGKIWCTSDTEVYAFHPENLKRNINLSRPNIVKINGIRIGLESINKTTEIPENDNSISIEFESIGLNASNNLTYSYILEGYDDEWSEYNKYTNCSYNNLSSGDYVFKVKNNQSDQISQQEISIDIPLYKEPYIGGVAGIASISFLLLSILLGRNSRLTKKNNQLLKTQEQQLRIEKSNLEELHRLEKENKALLEKQNKKLIFQKSELEGLNQKLKRDIEAIKQSSRNENGKLEIKTKSKLNYISASDLIYIHAEENGCRYFLKDSSSLWNDGKLKSWEESLDPLRFVRICRSTLVQKEFISKISYDKLSLVDGTELKIGRKYKQNL